MRILSNYRHDIQGLRALAVLSVFFFHLLPQHISGCFVGVDVFFVISGYLITGIILNKKEKNSFDFFAFYIGRFKRLFPVYIAFLIITLIASFFIFLPPDMFSLRNGVVWSSLFFSNDYLSKIDNYFGASSLENPILHTWTLSIEMQFYFLLPLILIFVKKRWLNWFLGSISVILLLYSFINSTFLLEKNTMYFSLLARIPEFFIGALFSINEKVIVSILKKWSVYNELPIIGGLLIVLPIFFYTERINFPGFWVLLPCIGTGFLLVSRYSYINNFLINKFMAHIGELSYSIYLWHWPIMAYIRYMNDRVNFTFPEILFIIAITYVVSYFSYRFIENIIRNIKTKSFILLMTIPIAILCVLLINTNRFNKLFLNMPIENIAPSFGLQSHGSTFEKVEVIGNIHKKNDSILLIGDSNALVYKYFFDILGKDTGLNFNTITNDIYPNIPNINENDFGSTLKRKQYERIVSETEKLLKKSKIIIFISAYSEEVPSIVPAIEQLITKMNKQQKIIFVSTFPLIGNNPIRINRGIIKKENKNNDYSIHYKVIPPRIKDIIHKTPNAYFIEIDYKNWEKDLPFHNNQSMYYDERHLNAYGIKVLYSDFGNSVCKQLNKIIMDSIQNY